MKKILFAFILSTMFVLAGSAQSIQEGIKHMDNENYAEALNVFNAICKADPKSSSVYYYIGEVHYRLEDKNEAEKSYRKGLSLDDRCAECYVGLGKLELDKGNVAEAEKHFKTAISINKKDASVHAHIGDAYLYSTKPNAVKAIEHLTNASNLNPREASYWAHLGEAYQLAGDSGEAMTSYERAVEKDPTNAEAYIRMARIWSMAQNEKLAIEHLEKAIKLSPNDARPIKDLYELYIREGDYAKVIPLLEKYVTLIGSDVDAQVRLVKFLTFQAKDYDRAIEKGEPLLAQYPDQYTLHRWLAWSYVGKAKRLEDARSNTKGPVDPAILENYRKAYDHSVKLFDAIGKDSKRNAYSEDYDHWAISALKIGMVDEAAHIYRKYIEFEPSKAGDIYGTLAKTYYDSSNYAQAIVYYKRKHAEKPLQVTDQFYLGMSNYQLKDYLAADSVFVKVLEATPDYAVGHLLRARIQDRIDSTDKKQFLAKPHYEKFVELTLAGTDIERQKKNLVEAYMYLGYYYVQQNQNQKGREYFQKVLDLDPTNETATEYISILKAQR